MHSQNVFHQLKNQIHQNFPKKITKNKTTQKIQRQKNNAEKRSESDVFPLWGAKCCFTCRIANDVDDNGWYTCEEQDANRYSY